MFLLNKYSWIKLVDRKQISAVAEYLGHRPTTKEVADDARDWLAELFSGTKYDLESTKIFKLHPNLIVDFVRYEIFAERGVIKLIFPRGLTDDSIREDYELITAIFLFHRHLSIFGKANLDFSIQQSLYSYCPFLHQRYTAISFGGEKYRYDSEDDMEALTQKLFATIKKTAFVFRNPAFQDSSWVIEFPWYSADDPSCVRLELTVSDHEDYDKETYSEYLNYLLERERNGIAKFPSTLSFWQNNVQLPRKNVNLENNPEPDKVLLLLCLALGCDHLVFDRLKELRRPELRAGLPVNRDWPLIDKSEEAILYDMLKDIHWLSMEARRQVKNIEDLPRRIILNANIKFLSENHSPLTELSESEYQEVEEKISGDILKKFYHCDNQKRQWCLTRLRIRRKRISTSAHGRSQQGSFSAHNIAPARVVRHFPQTSSGRRGSDL